MQQLVTTSTSYFFILQFLLLFLEGLFYLLLPFTLPVLPEVDEWKVGCELFGQTAYAPVPVFLLLLKNFSQVGFHDSVKHTLRFGRNCFNSV